MREENLLKVRIFESEQDQDSNGSKCPFPVRENQILFEIVDGNDKLAGFRIYGNKEDIDIERILKLLKSDLYFDRVDKIYDYIAD